MEKPTEKRKEREREARREAILDAAARVFSRKPYFEATLDEIAAEAELAKGTLYNYYKDKQNIFSSLVARGLEQFQDALDSAISTGGTLDEILRRCFETSLSVVRDHRYMYRLMLTAGAHLSEKVQSEVMEKWHGLSMKAAGSLADALAALPETSGLSQIDRLVGANLVFSAIHSLHRRQMIEQDMEPLREDIENYVRLLHRALTVEQI